MPPKYTPWPVLQNVRYDTGSDTRTAASRLFPSYQRSFNAVSYYRHQVSGTLHLPSRGTFQLSVTLLFRYRSQEVFSFGGWCPPNSRTISNARYSGTGSNSVRVRLRDCHTLWSAVSDKFDLITEPKEPPYNTTCPRRDSV